MRGAERHFAMVSRVAEPYRATRVAPSTRSPRPRRQRTPVGGAPTAARPRPPAPRPAPSRARPGGDSTELIDGAAGLRELAAEWDALAVAASNPGASPAWVLAWLRHVAPPDVAVRVIAVRRRGTLVGVVPLYVAHAPPGIVEYKLMGSDFGVCMEPLAMPGREWDVARELARVLASSRPRPDVVAFGPMTLASHWAAALRASWPGRIPAVARRVDVQGAPVIALRGESFDSWFASLSSKMRSNLRRGERQFEQAGGSFRWSTAATLRSDAEAFARLHNARWARRGWSRLSDLGGRLPDWVEQLGRELIDSGRFRMCVLELDGETICVDFHVLAGEELAAVNVGWDERYARLAPARIAALRLVEAACGWGCQRLSLGRGEPQNKLCLANGSDPVARTMVMAPSARLPRAYARALPVLLREHAREIGVRALPERWVGAKRPHGSTAPPPRPARSPGAPLPQARRPARVRTYWRANPATKRGL